MPGLPPKSTPMCSSKKLEKTTLSNSQPDTLLVFSKKKLLMFLVFIMDRIVGGKN